MNRNELRAGQIVKIAAWTDLFMRGVTHGRIESVGRKYASVSRGGKTFRVAFDCIESVTGESSNV